MHTKDFQGWHIFKERLHNKPDTEIITIKEREIWWCSIGVHVGDEEDGHNELYNRPVLVVKKFNRRLFWGIPLTTKIKQNKLYFPIELKGKQRCAMLSHLRLYDVKRLHSKIIGTLPDNQFAAIKNALVELIM